MASPAAVRSTGGRGPAPPVGAVLAIAATLAVVATVLVGAVVLRPRLMRVPSHSMEPTIESGSRVVIRTTVDPIARGDVVVFHPPIEPSRSFMFRVVVLPGERFAIVGGVVHVNGRALPEPYQNTTGARA